MSELQVNELPIIDSSGVETNPTTATVLATTGSIANPGVYEVFLTLGASAAAVFVIAHLNSAASNASDPQYVYVAAGSTVVVNKRVFVNKSDSLVVAMQANLTGTASVHLTAQRVA